MGLIGSQKLAATASPTADQSPAADQLSAADQPSAAASGPNASPTERSTVSNMEAPPFRDVTFDELKSHKLILSTTGPQPRHEILVLANAIAREKLQGSKKSVRSIARQYQCGVSGKVCHRATTVDGTATVVYAHPLCTLLSRPRSSNLLCVCPVRETEPEPHSMRNLSSAFSCLRLECSSLVTNRPPPLPPSPPATPGAVNLQRNGLPRLTGPASSSF